ncbi:echinoderm microtubule-associated protein-like CG42247 [Trichonephila clavata]|uniref:Echinoderm microtubule-associated protein-like CG42247 n=1 Tax=Trichonephila clavata TaxID=2740835 RepID=A0A8X6FFN7_TRICU|nr:echinoderm microtubule-associated protein-like CG42247 [Trichonephila clavata]
MKSSSGIRPSLSLGDLGEKRAFDVRVGYKKKIPPLGSSEKAPKALVVTVYRNGDSYFPGTKVSLRPGKHFLNLTGFCDYLSQRMKIPQGVRYIYDLNGHLINELKELQDGGSYVASGTKTFKDAGYGKLIRLHTSQKPNVAPLRREDMLLFRQPHHESLEGLSLPGSKESCLVTVVNRKEPAKRSRVLLNLRTRQIWEEVLRDMGESIGMRKASRMLTPWGEEVFGKDFQLNDSFESIG